MSSTCKNIANDVSKDMMSRSSNVDDVKGDIIDSTSDNVGNDGVRRRRRRQRSRPPKQYREKSNGIEQSQPAQSHLVSPQTNRSASSSKLKVNSRASLWGEFEEEKKKNLEEQKKIAADKLAKKKYSGNGGRMNSSKRKNMQLRRQEDEERRYNNREINQERAKESWSNDAPRSPSKGDAKVEDELNTRVNDENYMLALRVPLPRRQREFV